ncbi:MAG: T9SS type A sorting domain-containing protein [Flavobacterium sp.]|uniref:T9SS type A sorting domain-containing protein n=1 Tax=Flavobacterium sp. TaxID=239 RepID=UPI00120FEF99|nr:T9SS type A sorting domain-containing protein [Flavobacterium sp.]RZJ66414.1 MAG: T9SS type A sorting domain-containing protein [Flavobacterium sp.]
MKFVSGIGNDYIDEISSDASGNLYVSCTATSAETNYFGTTAANSLSASIQKLNASGELLWRSASHQIIPGLLVSAIYPSASGDFYMLASVQSTITIGTSTFAPSDELKTIVLKTNSSFTPIWAVPISGPGLIGSGISINASGDVALEGLFTGAQLTVGNQSVNNFVADYADAYFAGINSQGNVIFLNKMGGGSADNSQGSVIDNQGNRYFAVSSMSPQTYFGDTYFDSFGDTDAFLIKFSPSGTMEWIRHYGSDDTDSIGSLAIASNGDVLFAGLFDGSSITFAPIQLSGVSTGCTYVARVTPNGDAVFARKGVSNSGVQSFVGDLGVDAEQNIYLSGSVKGNAANFGNGITHTAVGFGHGTFLMKINADGTTDWLKTSGKTNSFAASKVHLTQDGDLYHVARFISATTTVDSVVYPNQSENSLHDGFLAKIGSESLVTERFDIDSFTFFPNPAREILHVNGDFPNDFIPYYIYGIDGRVIRSANMSVVGNQSDIDVSALASGIYILKSEHFQTRFVKR